MAAPPVTGAIAPSRYSLFGRINHISTDNDQLFDLIEELEKHAETAVRWRWHAATTQVKQDSIFKLYQAFLTGVRIITEDLNEQAKEIAIFPANKDNCLKRIRLLVTRLVSILFDCILIIARYIIFICKFGRGVRRSTKISYRGLIGYQIGLMFWCKRLQSKHGITTSPTNNELFNSLTEAMRFRASKFRLTVSASMSFTKVGLPELHQLIDYNTLNAASIKVSKGHHLAWYIARVYAIRPGSIGISSQRKLNTRTLPFLNIGRTIPHRP